MPRIFVAARVRPCPEPLRGLLARLAPLRRVKAVDPQNLHFTLRFFGDLDEETTRRLGTAVERAVAGQSASPSADVAGNEKAEDAEAVRQDPFDARFDGLRSFPREGRPKVLWVAPDEAAKRRLTTLAALVDDAAETVGLGERDRKFVPHLTVARLRGATSGRRSGSASSDPGAGRGDDAVRRLLREQHDACFGRATIDHVQLVESTLTPDGPVYEDRLEVPLQ